MMTDKNLVESLVNIDDVVLATLPKDVQDAINARRAVIKASKGDMEQTVCDSNAIFRELAYCFSGYLTAECIDCGNRCKGADVCEHQQKYRALVAKAMEIIV